MEGVIIETSDNKQLISNVSVPANATDNPVKKDSFYYVPSSPATNAIMITMSKGKKSLTTLRDSRKAINHHQKVDVLESGNARQISIESENSTILLELGDIDRFIGSNKPAKKFFILFLVLINQQAFSNGEMRRDFIQFPTRSLIDMGFYKDLKSARRGFDNVINTLTNMKISGEIRKGKNRIEQKSIQVLFTGMTRKEGKGLCTVYINPRVNWNFLISFYTTLPFWCYSLPNKAFDLIYYISYMARMRLKDIREKGYFTISMKAIHERLDLPAPEETKNPERDIYKPIEDAIEAIEKKLQGNDAFTITPYYKEGESIVDFINNGYLKIALKGDYAKVFIDEHKKIEKAIKSAEARKEKVVDKAKAINLAKKMERESAQEGDAS